MSELNWYVVHTYSGYENKVKANIEKTIENRKLQDQIFEVRVPLQEVVEMKGGVLPSKTPVDNPYVPVIAEATREVYGDYVVYPCRPSTAPDFLWTRILGLPAIQVRWSDPDSDNHAPNEHLTIEEYIKGIELTARVLCALGEKNCG